MSEENKKAIAAAIKNAKTLKKKNKNFLPDGCPVVPLGTKDGLYYYITPLSQLRCLKDKDHGAKQILSLFEMESNFLQSGRYARTNAKGEVTGWYSDEVARDLMASCAQEGIWEPGDKVRGAGAWRNDDGNIVIHCGDVIFENNREFKPGIHGSFVYPSEPKRQRPALNGAAPEEVAELLDLIKTWNWSRPDLDPYLLLGWIGAASIGGALKWRPLMWVTGDKGTGKSTLQDLIAAVFAGSLLAVSDTTPAGIWQSVKYSSLPVALDEIEPEDDNKKVQAVIKLARQACSGGVVLRGSSDGQAGTFKAMNCYFFSSILIPPLLPQDRSRMAILDLGHIGGKPPVINHRHFGELGSKILRKMLDCFSTFTDNIEILRGKLSGAGLDSRGCDQFGVLLAAADTLLTNGDTMDSDSTSIWVDRIKPMIAQERYENVSDHTACAEHLFTSFADIYKDGAKRTIGDWIAEAAGLDCSRPSANADPQQANKIISTYGLRVEKVKDSRGGEIPALFIASRHQGLAKVYENTHWRQGVWIQAFRRFSGATNYNTKRFNGVAAKCVYVPLDNLPLHPDVEEVVALMNATA